MLRSALLILGHRTSGAVLLFAGLLLAANVGCQDAATSSVSDSAESPETPETPEAVASDDNSEELEGEAIPADLKGQVEHVIVGEGDSEHAKMDFQEAIHTKDKLILVDFWASWCGPCRLLAPELEKVVRENPEKLMLIKIDVDSEDELAAHFKIEAIPDVRFVKNGRLVGGFLGFLQAEDIKNELSL